MRDYSIGLVLVTLSALAWSTAGLFTRMVALDVPTMLVWRGIFGALGLGAAILVLPRAEGGWRALGRAGWAYAAISALGMIAFILALRLTSVAHVSVIYATVPFLAAGLGWAVLGVRPGRGAMVTGLVALGGVGVMMGLGGDGGWGGDGLALLMTLAMAAMMVLARRFPAIPALKAALLSALISAALAWPLGSPFGVSGPDLAVLAAFGLVNSAAGLLLFTLGARYLPPIETALLGALDAPLAPVWVWLVFGERPAGATLLGGGIVFVAVVAHVLRNLRRNRG